MASIFQDELGQLRMSVLRMMNLSRSALHKSIQAVRERNLDLAEEVIQNDQDIDRLEVEVDKASLRLLALEQPFARDLRLIVGCMRMNTDIERIGDEASNIAERAIILHGRPALEPYTILEEFFELGLSMVGDAVQAFSDLDSALAESICARDQQAAHLNMKTFRDMTNYMIAESRMIERAVQISFVSHALKRVCDRATNIAESVVFIDKGVSIKHAGQCAV